MSDPAEIEAFLADFPAPLIELTDHLRALVRQVVPESLERLRAGWRLVGYDVPSARGPKYFAYVAPELEHVHLGFEYGVLLDDPAGLLQGAHLQLRQVRYLTFRPTDTVRDDLIAPLLRQAAALATLSRIDRLAIIQERDGR